RAKPEISAGQSHVPAFHPAPRPSSQTGALRRPRARRRYARFRLGPCSVWPEDVVAQQSSKRGARLAGWSNGRRVSWSLQRDPNTEEVDAPLVESRIPPGRLLIAEVVDWTVVPSPPGRRKG